MLLQLHIQNFAIVRSLDIDWQQGMTTITGETGAGKSIAIDALGLCLGDRATTNVVRPNATKAELAATFSLNKNEMAKSWLAKQDLLIDDECILRRVISAEGRSKAYINGSQVPLVQLKEVGQLLINIHGQHDHQLITKASHQRLILDEYANHSDLLASVSHYFNEWRQLHLELEALKQSKSQREAQQQLLQYQVNELDEFAIQPGEFETLESDYKRLSNSQQILSETMQSLQLLADDEQFNVLYTLNKCKENLSTLAELDPILGSVASQLEESYLQLEDSYNELRHYYEKLELDPESYQIIEDRYSTAIQLAKKHHVSPEGLAHFHLQLQQELSSINLDESRLEHIIDEIELTKAHYQEAAAKLTQSRHTAATKLSERISQSMHELNMPHGRFAVEISANEAMTKLGADNIEFQVSMNPGQALEAMNKVASGGELSRISLAMQVILAERVVTPTLIFDEVDVGISGPTAAMVGAKLQQLAKNTQVICVTHLPQVASKGHQQLFVAKLTDGEHTETTVTELSEQSRIQEIARLLAGDKITEHSLANAQELLAS